MIIHGHILFHLITLNPIMTTLKEKLFSRITDDFQVLSKVVIRQHSYIKGMLEDNTNEEIYTEINNNERIIDSLEVKLRNEVINTIVLYSPRATNLRMIISYYDMTAYLERIGDLILNISHFLLKTDIHGTLFTTYKNILVKMLALTENMTQNAIFAFTCEDIQLAKATIEADDQVDALHHETGFNLQHNCCGLVLSQQEIADALYINSMSYNIERIGDNATNIAEAAIYLIEGKNVKHWDKEGGEILQAGSEG